ncbi:hypothetical protein EC968_004988 [Mortierella alpina]|nr:hypothetical protein EC968_004988 [Mortierella alpina]
MPPKKAGSAGSKANKKQKLNDSSAVDAGKIMSKEEEEEMSSALIAQLLAQEGGGDQHGYYAEYNNEASYGSLGGDFSDDDDGDYRNDYNYRPKSKSRRGGSQQKKKAKRSAPATAPKAVSVAVTAPKASQKLNDNPSKTPETAISTAASGPELVAITSNTEAPPEQEPSKTPSEAAPLEVAASPIKAKKVKEVKEAPARFNTGVYSESEEKAFVEALDLFGRNWRSVEEHVQTRDSNSIRSHAQKHFIKLFRDNIPLPAKVLETGPGYTLSGNDLDPYSAAARPYLAQRLLDDPALLPKQGGTIFTSESSAIARAEKKEAKEKKQSAAESAKESVKEAVKEMKELKIRKVAKPAKEPVRDRARLESPQGEAPFAGRTDYSKARLRNTRDRSSISFRQMASDLDPLTMVKCEPFCGQPNSGVVGCQPFGIKVQSNVLLGMDFHAHLMTTEIIGFLAGDWNSVTRTIHIKAIFPCRSLPTGQDHVNVEMDPTSEFEVRQEIEKRNMRIVGWYHSHPTFTPDPSLVDIENQTSYQSLFKDDSSSDEPFVGAIVGPYDERLPGLSSVINWFYISKSPQERGHPKRLLYDLIEDAELPEEESALWTKLFDEYRDSPERTNFKEQWRQEESETKLQKMLVSLGRRMPWLRNSLQKSKDSLEPMESDLAHAQEQTQGVEQVARVEEQGQVSERMEREEEHTPEQKQGTEQVQDQEPQQPQDPQQDHKPDQVPEPVQACEPVRVPEQTQISELGESDKEGESMDNDHVTAQLQYIPEEPKMQQMQEGGLEECSEAMAVDETVLATELSEPMPLDNVLMEGIEVTESNTHDLSNTTMEVSPQSQPLERSMSSISSVSSASSSGSKFVAGLGTLIKDAFLIRVEQELATWEPVVG